VKIFRDALTFVVSPRHKFAKRRQVDISALGEEVFVAHIVESPFRNNVIQLFAKHHVPLEMRVELPTIESMKRFVQMDMGVAIVPRMCVRWEIEQGLLVEVKIKQLHMRRDLYLLHRRRGPLSHAAQAMLRLLQPKERFQTPEAEPEPVEPETAPSA
jgi:DNA-binding transcriptional LysR family regulator